MFSDEELIGHLVGDAPGPLSAAIVARMSESEELRSRVSRLERMMEQFRRAHSLEPLFHVDRSSRDRLVEVAMRGRVSMRDKLADLARCIVVSLVPRSETGMVPGFRGGGNADRLTFRCPGWMVDLNITETEVSENVIREGTVTVLGRVEGVWHPATAWVVDHSGERVCESDVDENGFFEFKLSAGEYDFALDSPGRDPVILHVDLSRESA